MSIQKIIAILILLILIIGIPLIILTPPKAHYEDTVFEAIGGDEFLNVTLKHCLKIDENDIEASHAAVVGKINDEHLFYLTSRGISETEAKELITFGYLKPILLGFKEEQVKEHISSLIEGRM